MKENKIFVIIPALNEEYAISKVIAEIPKHLVNEIIVVDNGSKDKTVKVAQSKGVTVLLEPIKGYGKACLKGIQYIKDKNEKPDIVVFLDGDYSDYPEEMEKLVLPILQNEADLVIGSRALGNREKKSMTLPQVFGNWLATSLMKVFYNGNFTDLGPFRAIRYDKLLSLGMKDEDFGWTIEMQIKALKKKLKCREVPVNYKKRIGVSKVSGTIKGTILAGYKILFTLFKYL